MWNQRVLALTCCLLFALTNTSHGQTSAVAHGTVDHVIVHGKLLEGNLEGDSPDRDVAVYLPPSYKTAPDRRYPVIYLLHGFTGSEKAWLVGPDPRRHLDAVLDRAIASGTAREMIVVAPNAHTRFGGSFYSQSVTTGDWEGFIATDLVSFIDGQYRTLASANSRGLAGHSMGGYGTLRIGLKHPEVFSSIYAMSPCCLMWGRDLAATGRSKGHPEAIHTVAQISHADFWTLATLAVSAAWSPDPKAAPFYLDLPVRRGLSQNSVLAKWSANMPGATFDQHIEQIRKLHAIAFDVGTRDEFTHIPPGARLLDSELTRYGVAHTFETYDGTHSSRIPERIEEKMLPFFSRNLAFAPR